MEPISDLIPNNSPGDPVSIISVVVLLHCLLRHVIEPHDVLEHSHRLVEGAVAVVLGVRVLLEEVLLYELGYF